MTRCAPACVHYARRLTAFECGALTRFLPSHAPRRVDRAGCLGQLDGFQFPDVRKLGTRARVLPTRPRAGVLPAAWPETLP
eukprot:302421-Lingulodinium_polyedra.AAC.1